MGEKGQASTVDAAQVNAAATAIGGTIPGAVTPPGNKKISQGPGGQSGDTNAVLGPADAVQAEAPSGANPVAPGAIPPAVSGEKGQISVPPGAEGGTLVNVPPQIL